jgi:hypothetical protein
LFYFLLDFIVSLKTKNLTTALSEMQQLAAAFGFSGSRVYGLTSQIGNIREVDA